ncbi:germination protein M [Evansella vedderi]|uniref:Germination protein M n=1 Tax=Evansella vedderi TaxID=38282 RepID=A0ABT9ZZ04_9BACI|nr:GerMN domain-containing protein [Evansella vedderi]MDQ0256470.1 germination protein M [Evansella vedderi]
MRRLKMKFAWGLAITAAITLTACGSDPVDQDVLEEIDPPQEIEFIDADGEFDFEGMEDGEIGDAITDMDGDGQADGEEEVAEKGGPVNETAMQELYLLDRNGLVAPQSFNIPKGDNEVARTVEYLIQGGPITEILPNGFQAVLPSGTEVLDATVSDGVATLNFSDQFSQYHPDLELQVLQALTWSVTQLDNVDRIKLQLNGEDLEMMPQNGTPISSGYTRAHGINLEMSDEVDLVNTKPVVVYFLSQVDNQTYYVPVTRRVPQQMDLYEAVVSELVKGPHFMSPLLTSIHNGVELLDAPELAADGTLTLNFNEVLLSTLEGTAVSEEVLNMLVLSLTEHQEVQSVALQVESEGAIEVSTGETLTEPVTRPSTVNTGEY